MTIVSVEAIQGDCSLKREQLYVGIMVLEMIRVMLQLLKKYIRIILLFQNIIGLLVKGIVQQMYISIMQIEVVHQNQIDV